MVLEKSVRFANTARDEPPKNACDCRTAFVIAEQRSWPSNSPAIRQRHAPMIRSDRIFFFIRWSAASRRRSATGSSG